MSDIAHNALGFFFGLGLLIFLHESGHFLMAKLFRVRVLVFSLGFGKRLFGFRKGDTDYRVSIFPLGGYVRMAGDTPEENVAGNPDEFLSKPKWQRFLILVAGPAMNILIAIAFVAALAMVGREEVILKPVLGDVVEKGAAEEAGLQRGDEIVSIDGDRVKDFDDVRLQVSMNAGTPLQVVYRRNGVQRTTTLTPKREESEYGPIGRAGFYPGIAPLIGRVDPDSPAARAGIRGGDRIVAANGKPVLELGDYADAVEAAGVKPVRLEVLRNGQRLAFNVAASSNPEKPSRGIIPPTRMFKLSLIPALRYSVAENWKMLKVAMTAVARMVRGEGSVKELSGPLSIAKISGDMLRRGPLDFLNLLAMISLQLGVMNLLPIPVLDGGHIMILLIEGAARRDLSLRVKERIQQLGFAVLATLMIVVLYNDVISNFMRMRNG
ncbi:MAG TPA: RIP metalloprotease RseP [Thermoanaerobaculia bacterium]|nr:RIP metalloprotease RseP [Thermoanaerobaculia bacterium]